MATYKETQPRRAQSARRHNRRSGSGVSAARGVRSTRDHLFSDQDGYGTTTPLVTALPIANPLRGVESRTTTSFQGKGHAGRQPGSHPISRAHGTAAGSTSRLRAGSLLFLSRFRWKGVPLRRRTWVSRAVLLGILIVQAMLSLQLQNTAFEDEALYITPVTSSSTTSCMGARCHPSSRGTSLARPCFTQLLPPQSTLHLVSPGHGP